jgi:uncharacterized protein
LRTKWKELGWGLLNLLAIVVVIAALQIVFRRYLPGAGAAILGPVVLLAYWLGCRWIERRRPTELAPDRALPELGFGLLAGVVLIAGVMGVLRIVGFYHAAGYGSVRILATTLVFTLLAGILEEIIFRGFLFRLIGKILGTWGALIVTSALFGAAHAGNRGATLGSSLAIAIEAGILLGAAYAATQRLWVPIGLHIGWNFCEGPVFGMAVSGNTMQAGLIQGSLSGPDIFTGGAFGPEASIVAVILCLAAGICFIWWTVKKQRIEKPAWLASPPTVTPSAPAA